MEKIISYIKEKQIKNILILSHQNADPDAFCGIFALKSILNRLISEVEINFASDELNTLSNHIALKLDIEIKNDLDNLSPDLLILFDVNNLYNTGKFSNQIKISSQNIIIIDHHAPPSKIEDFSILSIIDDEAISANEIIFHEFDRMEVGFTSKEALAILIGILYDSKHLILGNSRTFSIIPKLIEYGADYSLAISLLNIPMVRAEKIARLKAAQRLEIFEMNNWLIIFSHVSSYEASACRAIIGLGADVAFVTAEQKGEVRISARSTSEFYKSTNIHLGKDIFEIIGPIIDGLGGGHANAAGCNGTKNAEEANKIIIKILEKKLLELNQNGED